MKLFILVTFIGTAVGQLGQSHMYPGYDETNGVITKCTYWQGVESSMCHTFRFNKDSRTLNDFRPNYNMYGMMNGYDKLFGNAQMQPEPCSDAMQKYKYWKACPALYNQQLMDLTGDTNVWSILSGCATNETMCKMSCNLCGEENYITAAREVEKQTNLRCLKIMDHFPFSCMEKKVVETPLPSIFVIYLNEAVLNELIYVATVADNQMCVTFNFRRRASADCPLDSLSHVSVCTKKAVPFPTFDTSPNDNCQLTREAFTTYKDDNGGTVPEARAELIDNNYCMFNVWRKAFFTFENADRATGTADEQIGTELQIVIYRKVDHIDIDEVKVIPGNCDAQITSATPGDLLDYHTDAAVADGVFLGIDNVEE